MLIKYISFLIGVVWSYSIIKTQSVFSNKAGIIFKIFVTKVSWFTLIAACYFGYKNFTIKSTVIGVVIGVLLVNVSFYLLKNYITQRFNEKKITVFKSLFEYTLIFLVIYFVLF
jgi:putative Ca2+/H+ antiporter (TMEM165/GDT1 family)